MNILNESRACQLTFWCVQKTNELASESYPVRPFSLQSSPKGISEYDQLVASGFKPTAEEVLIKMNQLCFNECRELLLSIAANFGG